MGAVWEIHVNIYQKVDRTHLDRRRLCLCRGVKWVLNFNVTESLISNDHLYQYILGKNLNRFKKKSKIIKKFTVNFFFFFFFRKKHYIRKGMRIAQKNSTVYKKNHKHQVIFELIYN